jgi:hypothetical protein
VKWQTNMSVYNKTETSFISDNRKALNLFRFCETRRSFLSGGNFLARPSCPTSYVRCEAKKVVQ